MIWFRQSSWVAQILRFWTRRQSFLWYQIWYQRKSERLIKVGILSIFLVLCWLSAQSQLRWASWFIDHLSKAFSWQALNRACLFWSFLWAWRRCNFIILSHWLLTFGSKPHFLCSQIFLTLKSTCRPWLRWLEQISISRVVHFINFLTDYYNSNNSFQNR